jgi:Protein of unknown function (DUF1571)
MPGPLLLVVGVVGVAGMTLTMTPAPRTDPAGVRWPTDVPLPALIADARRAVETLGVYHATVVKTERLRGKVVGPETIDTWIREKPLAVRLTVLVDGRPARRILYNETVRGRHLLVRESGLLGFTSMWMAIDSWLVRRASNHTIREVGFGALLDLIDRDIARAGPSGGHRRADEPPGQGPGGTSCLVLTAPPAARNLYAARTRLCFDRVSRLPLLIEVFDGAGFLERYLWHDVRARQTVGDRFFTADGAGL